MQALPASPTRNGSRYNVIFQLSSSLLPSAGIDFEVVLGQEVVKGSPGLGEEQTVDLDTCVSSRQERGEGRRRGQNKGGLCAVRHLRPVW